MPLRVDQCCCGCTLKTGTILIAVYYIFGSLCILSMTTVGIQMVKHEHNRTVAQVLSTNESTVRGKGRFNATDYHLGQYVAGVTGMLAFFMVYSILSIILNVMLLIGAQKENLRLIYFWIIAHLIYLVVTVVCLLTNMFMTLLNPDQKAGSVGTSLINIVLTFYFLVVVSSYYQQIKDQYSATTPQAPPVVVYIDQNAPPPPYSELYPPWPQQNMSK